MITLYRSHLKRLRAVFARGLGSSARNPQTPVQFRLAGGNLTIAVQNSDCAVLYTMPLDRPERSFAIPFEMFKQCEGGKHEPVTIEPQEQQVDIRWTDGGIPQQARFDTLEPTELPPLPEQLASNEAGILTALQAAAETATIESSRYALGCLRLRGADGQIAATDGRQLLVEQGYTFPWEDAPLVPASKLFASKELSGGEPVAIGRTDDWVTLVTGPWTIHLRIQDARFPNLDDLVRQPGTAVATLQLEAGDARFLAESVQRLPCGDSTNQPVTVDLNGQVIVRALGESDAPPTELVLRHSLLQGSPLRVSTNRQYLARAMQLGFRSVEFTSQEAPACCRDDRRIYLWGLLGKDGVLLPRENAVQIESPLDTRASRPMHRAARTIPRPQVESSVPTTTTPQQSHQSHPDSASREPADRGSLPELIGQAQQLRQSLRDSLSQVSDVIAGLKQHQRQSKRLRSAVHSLRQLQAMDS